MHGFGLAIEPRQAVCRILLNMTVFPIQAGAKRCGDDTNRGFREGARDRFLCRNIRTLDVLRGILGDFLVLPDVLTHALASMANEQPTISASLWLFPDGHAHVAFSLRSIFCSCSHSYIDPSRRSVLGALPSSSESRTAH